MRMARFYFDLHECGTVIEDEDGVERSGVHNLREEAVAAARDIMCDELTRGHLCLSCHIAVRDESNDTILTVRFKDAVVITSD
jgi:hypothetical protein